MVNINKSTCHSYEVGNYQCLVPLLCSPQVATWISNLRPHFIILVILFLISNKPAWSILVSVSAYFLDLFPCVFHILNFELGAAYILFVLVKLQNLKHSASNNN